MGKEREGNRRFRGNIGNVPPTGLARPLFELHPAPPLALPPPDWVWAGAPDGSLPRAGAKSLFGGRGWASFLLSSFRSYNARW